MPMLFVIEWLLKIEFLTEKIRMKETIGLNFGRKLQKKLALLIVESVLMKFSREAFPSIIRLVPVRIVLDWDTRWSLMWI